MKRLVSLLGGVLLLLAAGPAWAEWVLIDESEYANTYVDPATIKKDGYVRRAWVLHSRKSPDKDGDLSYKGLEEFDCKQEKGRVLQVDYFSGKMGTGRRTGSSNRPEDWGYFAPDSAGGTMLKFLCSR